MLTNGSNALKGEWDFRDSLLADMASKRRADLKIVIGRKMEEKKPPKFRLVRFEEDLDTEVYEHPEVSPFFWTTGLF